MEDLLTKESAEFKELIGHRPQKRDGRARTAQADHR